MEGSPADQSITANLRQLGYGDDRSLAVLVVVGDAGCMEVTAKGRIITIDHSLFIGRRPPGDADLEGASWVVSDFLASARHARIAESTDGRGFDIVDLGSTNGTVVDGVTITGRTPLRSGAMIFIGQHAAVFRVVTQDELLAMSREMADPFGPVPVVGPDFASVCDRLRRLAPGQREILLVGETGVGKEVYARAVHNRSGCSGAFVAVNCAAIPRDLVESELFGYSRGAHSQAREAKRGLIEEAEGGTLFLDEIGEMAQDLQAKLLRFTQDRLLMPIGGTRARAVSTRILAATNRLDPPTSTTSAGLRSDLAARLGAQPVRLPPLRDHIEDLGVLTTTFLQPERRSFNPVAFHSLCLYSWPGNVRELQKVIEEARLLSDEGAVIEVRHLPVAIGICKVRGGPPADPRKGYRAPPEAAELDALLRRFHGNVARVARELDRQPALIYRWAERFHLDVNGYRDRD